LSRLDKRIQAQLNVFVDGAGCMPGIKDEIKLAFGLYLLNHYSIFDLVGRLMDTGMTEEQSKGLILRFLSMDQTDEFKDPRPDKFSDARIGINRIRILESLAKDGRLTKTGQRYVEALLKAYGDKDTQRFNSLMKKFPTVKKPRLEYFKQRRVDKPVLKGILNHLKILQITTGCSQMCRHCAGNPGHNVQSIPFYRILNLQKIAKGISKTSISRGKIFLYYDSHALNYYDPLFDADLVDVVQAMMESFPAQYIELVIRPPYRGDRISVRAAKKLAAGVRTVLDSPAMREQAKDLGRRMASESGVAKAVELVNEVLP